MGRGERPPAFIGLVLGGYLWCDFRPSQSDDGVAEAHAAVPLSLVGELGAVELGVPTLTFACLPPGTVDDLTKEVRRITR